MKRIEKIALIWVIPMSIIAVISAIIGAVIVYVFIWFLNITGTVGAFLHVINLVRKEFMKRELKKMESNLKDFHKFDSLLHKTQ
jgi:bacteriorhodopsin